MDGVRERKSDLYLEKCDKTEGIDVGLEVRM